MRWLTIAPYLFGVEPAVMCCIPPTQLGSNTQGRPTFACSQHDPPFYVTADHRERLTRIEFGRHLAGRIYAGGIPAVAGCS